MMSKIVGLRGWRLKSHDCQHKLCRSLQARTFPDSLMDPHPISDSLGDPRPISGFRCYEGNCCREQNPKVYVSQQSLRQHRVRAHTRKTPQESSTARVLKRKREAEVEALQKRQRLEEEERVAASRALEPEPMRPVRCLKFF